MKTATIAKEHPDRSTKNNSAAQYGPAALYRLSDPMTCPYVRDGAPFSYVYVSSSVVCGAPETYAFAAEESGDVISWSELDGSQKGDASHADVLRAMGYELVCAPEPSSGAEEKKT